MKIITASPRANAMVAYDGATFTLRLTKDGRYFVQKPHRQRSVRICNSLITSDRTQLITDVFHNSKTDRVDSEHLLAVDSASVACEPDEPTKHVLVPAARRGSGRGFGFVPEAHYPESIILWFPDSRVSLRIPSESGHELDGMDGLRVSPEARQLVACLRKQVIADDLIMLTPGQTVVACYAPELGSGDSIEPQFSTWRWTGKELYANDKKVLPLQPVKS